MSNSQPSELGSERALRSTARNPRRRQRQSDDSLRTAPRRKRSKISENTYVSPSYDEEEEINDTIEVSHTNGDIHHGSSGRRRGRPRKASVTVQDTEMPLRGKRTSIRRPARTDGATVLTQNSRYTLKMLPSSPKELRKESVEYRGSLGAVHQALAITRERAYLWEYTSHAPVNNPRVFSIPFPMKPTDPIPFGALVATGSGTELGLVLICATTGQIVFYESVERAASLGLFQERNVGVQGSLGGLFSGETVTDIVSADHAGFIVTLSSGRIAQITLRDTQGKPRIFAQFLRAAEQSSGGLFGSIKGILSGGGWKRDVSAIHTRSLGTRGQMQLISLTERAELQIWDLDWSGQYSFQGTVDFREMVTEELKKGEQPELQGQAENVTTLDFAILEKTSTTNNNEVATIGTEIPVELVILLKAGPPENHGYALLDISIEGQSVNVSRVLPLTTYFSRLSHGSQSKPRLLIPKPRHTAFIAFQDAITVVSMDNGEEENPEAQLHASYIEPASFEDTVYLKQGNSFAILGACEEDSRGGQASGVAFVKGAGLVRLSVADPQSTNQEARLAIKSKIEQAVFYGALQEGNIVDFSSIDDSNNSPDEVEEAALAISDEILRSTSSFISTTPTSMDSHLAYKGQVLRALVTYVRQNYPASSRAAMWQLLWDAEKVAAAQQMWKAFEGHVAACSQTKRTATLLDEACSLVLQKSDDKEIASNDDAVRTFFIHSLHRIESLLPMICTFLRYLKKDGDKPSLTKVRLVDEGDDIWNTTLETVFAFRAENASVYGVLPTQIRDGVLTDAVEYAELPEFWTSTEGMLKSVVHMAEVSRQLADEEFEMSEGTEAQEALEPLIFEVGAKNPRLIQSLCLIYQERVNWLASRPEEKDRQLAERLRENYEKSRYDQFRALANIGQTEAGMKLAEKYGDMSTLTEMVVAEMQFAIELLNDPEAEASRKTNLLDNIEHLTKRIGGYFDRFGDKWANAYFDQGFSGGKAGVMLRDAQQHWQDALTKYLRVEQSRAKIGWINDITAGKDFGHATESLMTVASEQETRLWHKKVELSMGKLALLATQEDLHTQRAAMPEQDLLHAIPQGDLFLIDVQERLYQHLLPEITHCIDHEAELQVAMEKYAFKNQDLHSLKQLLESDLGRVLNHTALSADELIDVLTLMDNVINDIDHNLQGQEFFLALKVLDAIAPSIPQGRFETLLQLIWKRCYVYDDWIGINNSTKKSSHSISDRLRQTAVWHTLFYAQDEGFFDSPDSHIRRVSPRDCLDAGCRAEELSYRWSNSDLLDPILRDNKIQDEQLEHFVTDWRLDQWIDTCAEDVRNTVQEKADDDAQRLQEEREYEASSKRGGTHQANGHSANGIKVEEGVDHDDVLDVDGDSHVR